MEQQTKTIPLEVFNKINELIEYAGKLEEENKELKERLEVDNSIDVEKLNRLLTTVDVLSEVQSEWEGR